MIGTHAGAVIISNSQHKTKITESIKEIPIERRNDPTKSKTKRMPRMAT